MTRPASQRTAEVLRVDLSALAPSAWRTQAAVIASLPGLLSADAGRGENGAEPDVEVVDGTNASWPGMVAQALGKARRGVLVSAPAAVPPVAASALAERADRAGCAVVVALPFQFDPGMRAGWLRPELSLVESVLTVPADDGRLALRAGLLAQVAAVRSGTGDLSGLELRYDTPSAYLATGLAGATTVMLSGVRSPLLQHVLRADLVGIGSRHVIRLHENPLAAPTLFTSYGGSGMSRQRLSYSGGLRAAWRNLHAAVTAAEPVRYSLPELARDLTVLP